MRPIELSLAWCALLAGCRGPSAAEAWRQPIVGGTLTAGHPSVGYVSADDGSSQSGCTGTLIRDRWFLTASHCLEETSGPIKSVKVTFEADSDTATVWHTAKSWAQHPLYGKPFPGDAQYYINRGYDCALVELNAAVAGASPIPFGSFTIDSTYVGRPVTQVGYGFTNGSFQGSGHKRELATQVADVHDGVLGLSENGTGTCQGDSGGPTLLVENGVSHVVGVSSYGSPGCPGGGWMSRTHLCAAWLDGKAGPFASPSDGGPGVASDGGNAVPDLLQPPAPAGDDGGSSGGPAGDDLGTDGKGATCGCQLAPAAAPTGTPALLGIAFALLVGRRRFR